MTRPYIIEPAREYDLYCGICGDPLPCAEARCPNDDYDAYKLYD
jgi:hypothetical protein